MADLEAIFLLEKAAAKPLLDIHTWTSLLLHIVGTNSSHSAYSALQPIHSPKQLIVHPATFCEKSYLSYRFWGWNFMPPARNMPPAHFPDKFQSHHLSHHYFPHIGPVQQPDWNGTTEEWEILTSLVNWMCYSVQTNSKQPMHCSCRNWKHTKSCCISAEIQRGFVSSICFTAAHDMQGRDLS